MSTAPAPTGKANLRDWTLRVISSADAEPNMHRVTFTCDDIAEFDYLPGQAIVFFMTLPNGETGRRHYTIRSMDRAAGTFDVDFLKHGASPATDWAKSAKAGDTIVARGPRGKTTYDSSADWHLMTGDETCIPAFAHILETMPEGKRAYVFLETDGPAGEIAIETKADADIRWLHRNGAPAGPNNLMFDAVEAFELPQGIGRALIIGETSNVRRQRHALIARGLTREQISSEGYWRPDRVGGHDHVDD
ncbi:siderophore-interacting protein [Aquamicrobium zhengzhouense]|uniref:Siderophore-interacting protein n=1 Tax=Aquamicrobium zhengzhouense TaxID=2781738 RepID=A0ABS0SIW4_9HYPH|nr:siderophore-interacting protein [Aquamicrobium zhengzhouense]MBI1622547.1 siderophore-interacting protein [Aquamicrobium zhengzhouense]